VQVFESLREVLEAHPRGLVVLVPRFVVIDDRREIRGDPWAREAFARGLVVDTRSGMRTTTALREAILAKLPSLS
jgi:hypothetical protein